MLGFVIDEENLKEKTKAILLKIPICRERREAL